MYFTPSTTLALEPRRVARIAYRAWLAGGTLAVLLVPAARGVDPLLGLLPLWLVGLPAMSLVLMRLR